jgi:SAM-dependent methyltransferase
MKYGEAVEYERSAEYYDLMVGDHTAQIDFYSSLVLAGQSSFVDLACGTGVVTVAVARAMRVQTPGGTHRICGIDGSTKMLERARSYHSDIQWLQDDIRHVAPMEPFELAACCFHTLQAFDRDGLALVLQSARNLLIAGGRFAFDIYRPNWSVIRREPQTRIVRSFLDAQGRSLDIQEVSSFDVTAEVHSLHWTLRDVNESPPIDLAKFHFRFWQHEPELVEALLHEARFTIVERYGDLDKSAFGDSSKRQVLVCKAV